MNKSKVKLCVVCRVCRHAGWWDNCISDPSGKRNLVVLASLIQSPCWEDETEMKQPNCCSTGTWIDLVTAALINTNYYTGRFCMDVVVRDIKRWKLLLQNGSLLYICTILHPRLLENKCLLLQNTKCLRGSWGCKMVRGEHCESIWWKQRTALVMAETHSTFFTFISRNTTGNGLFCLNLRPTQPHEHELFYKTNENGNHTLWLVSHHSGC